MRAHSSESAADVIIPVCNQYSFTRNLLEGIYRYTDVPFHIYIVDNASTDDTADLQKSHSRHHHCPNRENRGWSAGIIRNQLAIIRTLSS